MIKYSLISSFFRLFPYNSVLKLWNISFFERFSFENGCLRIDFDLKKTESKLELEQYIRQSQKWVTHFFVPLFHYFSQKRARNFWNAREKEKNQRKTGKNARKTTKMRRKTLILHIFGSFSSRKWVKSYNSWSECWSSWRGCSTWCWGRSFT